MLGHLRLYQKVLWIVDCDYIHNIFTLLRKVDKENYDLIIIDSVKPEGLGLAIMNRLLRTCEYNVIK